MEAGGSATSSAKVAGGSDGMWRSWVLGCRHAIGTGRRNFPRFEHVLAVMRRVHFLRLLVICLALPGLLAASAQARWGPSVDLGPAVRQPVIGFDPSGGAALAWGLPSSSDQQDVAVARAAFGSDLGAPEIVATGVPDPSMHLQIVLAGGGTAVLRTGARVFVAPGATTTFGASQDLGGMQEGDLAAPDARLIATLKGDVIASVMHSDGNETIAVLPAGSSGFGDPHQYPSLNPDAGQPVAVASDPQGSAFLADLATNCSAQNDQSVVLATRPPGGSFRLSTALRCHPIFSPNPFPVVATGEDGGLALLTVTGTPGRYALVVQTRYRGRLSRPHTLARSARLPNPLGAPVVNVGGGVTIGWLTCTASGGNCTESAARGSLSSGTWHTRTFGQPGEQVGNGFVALSRCARGVCQISVSLVDRDGRFGNPSILTRDGQIAYRDELIEASGGRRRERAIVWTSSHGGLFASVSDPGRPGFGPIRQLAADATVSDDQVAYQTGPRDQVIATWLSPDGTAHAAIYAA